MTTKVLLAGATGVVGRSLIPFLLEAGHIVAGTTRTADGKAKLQAMGVRGTVVDVFDADALEAAVYLASPDVVIHQLTDLSGGLDPKFPEEGLKRNARLRREGTANLARAATRAGVKRVIAQSIGWAYASRTGPYFETDPLDIAATGARAISVLEGVIPLESAILDQNAFEGLILRYGQLYGPGAWSDEPSGASPVHVEAAAYAAFLAVDHGRHGVYNIAEPGGALVVDKAWNELGWRPGVRVPERA